MIQFNLLPDVKQDFLKAKRTKHTVIVVSLLVAASALFVFVMLLVTVYGFQKNQISTLTKKINEQSSTLKSTKDLDKILTIQNQLNSLPDLHDRKPVTSRLFTYVSQLTPDKVSIGKLEVDFAENTLNFTGKSDSLSTINKFVDTLKFTTYVDNNDPPKDTSNPPKPFSDVVLSEFSVEDGAFTYSIKLAFNPDIFNSSKNIVLTVPNTITSRSQTEKPSTDLFQALPEKKAQ